MAKLIKKENLTVHVVADEEQAKKGELIRVITNKNPDYPCYNTFEVIFKGMELRSFPLHMLANFLNLVNIGDKPLMPAEMLANIHNDNKDIVKFDVDTFRYNVTDNISTEIKEEQANIAWSKQVGWHMRDEKFDKVVDLEKKLDTSILLNPENKNTSPAMAKIIKNEMENLVNAAIATVSVENSKLDEVRSLNPDLQYVNALLNKLADLNDTNKALDKTPANPAQLAKKAFEYSKASYNPKESPLNQHLNFTSAEPTYEKVETEFLGDN